MPHKRAKHSAREQQRSQAGHDNAPAKSALSHEAIPKGAARVLNAWKVQEEYRKKRKLGENGAEDLGGKKKRRKVSSEDDGQRKGSAKKVDMRIQPGESLAHFNRRVEDSLRPLVRDAMQTSAAVTRKARKEEEQERAARKAANNKAKHKLDDDADAYEDDEDDPPKHSQTSSKPKPPRPTSDDPSPTSPQKVTTTPKPNRATEFTSYSTSAPRRLNDIVQAPPELKKLPRGAKPRTAGTPGSGTKSLKEGALSMAQKAMMEEERERAIKAYREMKKRNAVAVE
ncbi:hypothetical protein BC629DRAFT_1441063 [Irpex lacteus]|nr:hypothetical protein BC629DRAFT_1441063 [Irpex lacteus]